MSNSKIHIDQLFAKGLENLEIPVFSNDFENIQKDFTPDDPTSIAAKKEFEEFELAVSDADWEIIKERLAKEKKKIIVPLPLNNFQESFKDFEIAVTDADWNATKSKLKSTGQKKLVWWWWLNIAIIGTLIGLAIYHFVPSNNSTLANAKSSVKELKSEISNIPDEGKDISKNITESGNNKEQNAVNDKQVTNNKVTNSIKSKSGNDVTENIPAKKFKNTSSIKTIANSSSKQSYIGSIKNTYPSSIENTSVSVAKENELKNDPQAGANENPEKAVAIKNEVNETQVDNPVTEVNKGVTKIEDVNAPSTTTGNETVAATETKPSEDAPKPKATSTPVKPPTLKLPFNFYFGLTTDIARTYRQLSKSNDPTYNSIRNNADKPTTQFSYGIAAGFQKGKNQFQTGFQLTQQTFTSNYNYTLKQRDSLAVYDTSGRLIGKFPIGPEKDTSIDESNHITIKKIDIPFAFNRLWKLDSKTQLITGFGGVFSINTKTEGTKILNPANNQLYYYSYLKGSEQKLGFSPNVNLGIQREIGKNFVLQTNIFGKYSVTNRYDTNYTAKQYSYSKNASGFTAKEYIYSYGLSIKLLYLLH